MLVLPDQNTQPRTNSPEHIQLLCLQSSEARLQARSKDALTLALQAAEDLKNLPADEHNPGKHALLRWSVSIEAALVNLENLAEYPDALRFALAAWRVAEDYATLTGEQRWRSFALNVIGDILVRARQPQEGLQYCLLALPMRIAEGDTMSLCWSLVNTAKAYLALGNIDHALQYAHTAQKYTLSDDMHYPATVVSMLLAKLYLLRSKVVPEFAAAWEAISHAESLARGTKAFPQLLAEILAVKSAIMRHKSDMKSAVEALDEAEIIAGDGELRAVLVEVYRERAMLPAALHKKEVEAAILSERAPTLEQRIQGNEVRESVMRILEGISPQGEEDDLLNRLRASTHAAFTQEPSLLPVPLYKGEYQLSTKSQSLHKPAPILIHNVLTATEWHIASLFADGWTSMEIAETLYISESTAKRHRDNIGEKIGSYYGQSRATKRMITRFVRSFG